MCMRVGEGRRELKKQGDGEVGRSGRMASGEGYPLPMTTAGPSDRDDEVDDKSRG